jgi:hypothetical protein
VQGHSAFCPVNAGFCGTHSLLHAGHVHPLPSRPQLAGGEGHQGVCRTGRGQQCRRKSTAPLITMHAGRAELRPAAQVNGGGGGGAVSCACRLLGCLPSLGGLPPLLAPLQMLLETLKWRSEYHPERLNWDNIKHEGARGKLFILQQFDRAGRPVVLMRPRCAARPGRNAGRCGRCRRALPCLEAAGASSRGRGCQPGATYRSVLAALTASHLAPLAHRQAGGCVQRQRRRARQVAGVHPGAGGAHGGRSGTWVAAPRCAAAARSSASAAGRSIAVLVAVVISGTG